MTNVIIHFKKAKRISKFPGQGNDIFEKYELHTKKWKNELKGNCFDLSFDDKIIDLDFFEALSPSGDKLNLFETAKTNIQVKPYEFPVAKYLHFHLLNNLDKEREVKPIFINKEQSITEQLQQKIPDINKYVFTLKLYKESEIKDLASESLANELKKIMDTKKDVSYPALIKYSLKEPTSANSIGCVSEEKILASLKNCMTTLFEDVLSKKTEEMKKQLKEEIKQSIDASLSNMKCILESLIGNETKSMESKINIKLSESIITIQESIGASLSNIKNELKSSLGNENKSLENKMNIHLSENKTEIEKSLDTSLSNIKNELKLSLCNDIKSMENRMNIQLSENKIEVKESVDKSLFNIKNELKSSLGSDMKSMENKISIQLSENKIEVQESVDKSLLNIKNGLNSSFSSDIKSMENKMNIQLSESIINVQESVESNLSNINNELNSSLGSNIKNMKNKMGIQHSECTTNIQESIDVSLSNMKNELKSSFGNENKSMENKTNIQLSENKIEIQEPVDANLSNINNELNSSLGSNIKNMENKISIQLSENKIEMQESGDPSLPSSKINSQVHYDDPNNCEKPIIDKMLSELQEDIKKLTNISLSSEKRDLQTQDNISTKITENQSVKLDEKQKIETHVEHDKRNSLLHNGGSLASDRNPTDPLVKQDGQKTLPKLEDFLNGLGNDSSIKFQESISNKEKDLDSNNSSVVADQKSQSQVPELNISQPDQESSLFPETYDIPFEDHDFIKKCKLTILKEELTIDFIFTCDSSDEQGETVYILKEDCSDLNDSINAVTLNIPKGKQDICQSMEISEECLSAGFKIIFGSLPNEGIIIENGTYRFSEFN